MIADFSYHRCDACFCLATRVAIDEYGEHVHLCDRCPTPDEIRSRAAAVRATWSEEDYWCRHYRCALYAARLERHVALDKHVCVDVSHAGASGENS